MAAVRGALFIVVLFLVFGIPGGVTPEAGAAGPPESIVAVGPAWENYTGEGGSGLYFELIRKVYESRGIGVETMIAPWARAKALVLEGRADCLPAAYLTPEDDRWAYPDRPIDVDRTAAVFLRDAFPGWTGPDTLSGRRVVWPRGYNFHNYLDVKVDYTEIDRGRQGWDMIDRGRADFYMDILPEIESGMRAFGVDASKYRVEIVFSIKTYLRFAAGSVSEPLRRIWDEEIDRLLETGELENLFLKWTGEFPEEAFSE